MGHLSVMCSMCSCFLDAIQTRLGSNQQTRTNLELSSAFAGKFEGGADKKAAKSEKLFVFECKRCTILIG